MSKNLLLSCLLGAVIEMAGFVFQAGAASPEPVRTNYVSIETPAGGEPMLVVRYPWKVHKKPSIEVRTYVQGEEESARVRPLHFRRIIMTDDVTIAVFETQAASALTRTVAEFARRDIDFVAIGNRNLFGRPAVCVTCETPVLQPNREAFPEKARWAIYPLLEPWAADDRTLFLSLPDSKFADGAKIHVFFLRDNDITWSEIKQWPGLKKSEATSATAPTE